MSAFALSLASSQTNHCRLAIARGCGFKNLFFLLQMLHSAGMSDGPLSSTEADILRHANLKPVWSKEATRAHLLAKRVLGGVITEAKCLDVQIPYRPRVSASNLSSLRSSGLTGIESKPSNTPSPEVSEKEYGKRVLAAIFASLDKKTKHR